MVRRNGLGEQIALIENRQIGADAQSGEVESKREIAEEVDGEAPQGGIGGPGASQPLDLVAEILPQVGHGYLPISRNGPQ